MVGQKDALVDLVIAVVDEEFVDAVGGGAMSGDGEGVDIELLSDLVAQLLGEVGHFGEVGFGPAVEVQRELFAAKFGVFSVAEGFGQLGSIHSD